MTVSSHAATQIDEFDEKGFLVLRGLLPAEFVRRLTQEVDHWVDSGLRQRSIDACLCPERSPEPEAVELEMAAHGELVAYPPLLELLENENLLGPAFVFHHLHSDRRPPGAPGKPWHHDYEQRPQRHRRLPMVHVLHYVQGLRPGMGALAVLPGSHHEVAEKDARSHLGTGVLPGEALITELPPGSAVVLHSALFHTRRAAGASAPGEPDRYLIDASYCRTGEPWPPVKPYWRRILAAGRKLRDGQERWQELFEERHFSAYESQGAGRAA
ncbi:phytanoyl-CoA dioxygenase family protein [Streptomyces sp. NBC_00102]|uniref:phytanoyl-CoA dioxygenase family protein n=1 Tax=Streptomyces sp. NBC_00102 TaxID=2975652 RepID=UPI002250506F|nr:phytanoyl-CoA dioxygenase family protein [Streptomyces sp. NBC_00102]MCX5398836.1 phytanoyl-CoA dioxygenase family protein [Streptomyces sp. NBC_00102]